MIIGVKRKFVFVANSKTGSTTIESVLSPYAEVNRIGSPQRKHVPWQEVRQEYAFIFDNELYPPEYFFRFGVVREPADWILSWYNYRRFRKQGGIPKEMSLEDFWESDDWVKSKSNRQLDHFVDDDGVCRFDLIIPLERLPDTLPVLLRSLGVKSEQNEIKNKSIGSLRRAEVPMSLWNEINSYYREDWEFYKSWKTRFDKVFPEVLEGFFPESLASETETGGDVTSRNIDVSKVSNQIVQHARLVADESPVSNGKFFNIRGVVLLKNSFHAQDMSLFVRDASGTRAVNWGLPSPKLSKKFPENIESGVSRFKADQIRIEPNGVAEIAIVESNGRRHILFLLENTS